MRATVPVYDDSGQYMVGYVARSINDKCPICDKYHYYKHPCPRNAAEENFARKWKNNSGFYSGATLYNIWGFSGKTAVLVEGPGDVWKLYEAGCKNGLGLFGCKLTRAQLHKLITLGVENIVLCLDNDEAGKSGTEKIIKQLDMYFNVDVLELRQKDLGDTDIKEVQNLLKGLKWQLLE